MTRRHLSFSCEGARLFGTIDLPEASSAATSGLLIVSGGNEIRSGAWSGQAMLAAQIARAGFPVLRFDRRGIGESEGENRGFRHSGLDIAAALAAFRAEMPHLKRVVGLGNCDAASALMLGGGDGFDGLVLSNPWTFPDETDESPTPPPPAALRAHYARRLADPSALLRLLSGKVSPVALLRSLRGALAPTPPSTLADEIAAGLARFSGPVQILLADRDRTAQAFLALWERADSRILRCPGASHSFVEPDAQTWLKDRVLAALG